MLKKLALGSSALVGLAFASPAPHAAEVTPGGALNITISGFIRGDATWGDIDNLRLDDSYGHDLDFFNDTEVHVIVKGKNDATGIEYGGTVEFEADTNRTDNTDETWLFIKGAFGEIRLGDEDGTADADGLAVSADTVSQGVGTDGLDSDQLELFAGGVRVFEPYGTNDATKVRYYTPRFDGFQFGVSYTPNLDTLNSGGNNGDNIAVRDVEAGDVVEGAVNYKQDFGAVQVTAALSGLWGDIKDEDTAGGDDYWAYQAGAVIGIYGLNFAGGFLQEKAGDIKARSITAGVERKFGKLDLALTYGRFVSTSNITGGPDDATNELGNNPSILILSGTLGLLPGLTLAGDVAGFDNDVQDGPKTKSDTGYEAIVRLGLAL